MIWNTSLTIQYTRLLRMNVWQSQPNGLLGSVSVMECKNEGWFGVRLGRVGRLSSGHVSTGKCR